MRIRTKAGLWLCLLAVLLAELSVLQAAETELKPLTAYLSKNTILYFRVKGLEGQWAQFKQTEVGKMMYAPEIQAFWGPAVKKIDELVVKFPAKDERTANMDKVEAMFRRTEIEIAFYEKPDDPHQPLGKIFRITTSTPDDLTPIKTILQQILPGIKLEENKVLTNPDNPASPAVIFNFNGLLVCDSAPELERHLKTQPADGLASLPDFKEFQTRTAPCGFSLYTTPAAVVKSDALLKMFGGEPAQVKPILTMLGMNDLAAATMGMGMKAGNPSLEFGIRLREGADVSRLPFWSVLPNPISKQALAIVPQDAPYVTASHVNWLSLYQMLNGLVGIVDQEGKVNEFLGTFRQRYGFDIEKDFVNSLGTEMVACTFSFDTSPPMAWGGAPLLSLSVRDQQKLAGCLSKLSEHANQPLAVGQDPFSLQFRKLKWNGQDIFYIKQSFQDAVAFAQVGEHLLLSTSINSVKRGLEQLSKKTSIVDNKDLFDTLSRMSGKAVTADSLPPGFAYSLDDSNGSASLMMVLSGIAMRSWTIFRGFEEPMPDANPGDSAQRFVFSPQGQALCEVMNEVEFCNWPDEGFFKKYRRSRGLVYVADGRGLYILTELPFPMPPDNKQINLVAGVAVVGVLSGLMLPVLSRARTSAREVSSLNNLKQLGLCCHIYADGPGKFAFPKDPYDLFPDFAKDPRLAVNPAHKDDPVSYVYISGLMPEDADLILWYELHNGRRGRGVATADGMGRVMTPEAFDAALENTKKKLKASGREFKEIQLNTEEVRKRCLKKGVGDF